MKKQYILEQAILAVALLDKFYLKMALLLILSMLTINY